MCENHGAVGKTNVLFGGNLSRLIWWWVTADHFVESDFCTKLKQLDVEEGKKDTLFADHVTQVCEAHNWAMLSFLQQEQVCARPTTEGSRENSGHNVHV